MRILLLPLLLLCVATPKVKADDVITPWSQALRTHLLHNQISNSETARQLAMLHMAQHLAVQDVFQTRGLQYNNQQAQRSPDLQPELRAAVAGASKQVLDRIAPQASAAAMPIFNSQTQMQPGNNNVPQQRLQQAQARGAQVADQVLGARVNDASDRTVATPWMGTNEPGKWRATPPDNIAAVDMQWAKVTPWVLDPTALNQQFRMPPPPDLNSDTYRNSYFELRELGRQGSTTRTPDMSAKAEFWTVNPQLTWMQVMDQLTATSPNSPGANPSMPRLQLQINGPPPGANNGNMNGAGGVGINGAPIGGVPGAQNPNPLGPPVMGGQPGALPGQVGGPVPNANAPFQPQQQQQGVNGLPLSPNMPPNAQMPIGGAPGAPNALPGQQPGAPLGPNALPGQPGALPGQQGQMGQNGQNGLNPNALPGQPGAVGVGGVNGQNNGMPGQNNGMNNQQNQNGLNNNNNMNNNNNNNQNGMNNQQQQNQNGMNNNGMNNNNNGQQQQMQQSGQVQHTPDGRVIMSIPETARAYAMATVAAMDTRVATFDNKYFFNAWRPITAIRNGGPGQGMEAQPGWEPFLVTPAAPEYPNGHASLGGAMCEILSAFNNAKNEAPFPFVLVSPNGQQRTYHSMSQISDESAVSRVFSGGHWQHTTPPSMALGKQVGQTILKEFDGKYQVTSAAQTLQQQQQRAAVGQQVLAGPGGAQVGVGQPGMQGQPGQMGQPGQPGQQQQMGQPGVLGQPMQPGQMPGQMPGQIPGQMPGQQQQGGVLGQPMQPGMVPGQQQGMMPGQQPGMNNPLQQQQQQQQQQPPQQPETPAQARRRRQRQRKEGNRSLRA